MICTNTDSIMHSFDNSDKRRLVVFMRAVLTANTIRAARGLAGLGRPLAADLLNISVVTLSIIEGDGDLSTRLDSKIRAFFDEYGIQLFGWIDVTSNVAYGEGVRWKDVPSPKAPNRVAFWPDRDIQNYQVRAARGLLKLSAEELAKAINSSRNTIRQVEAGKSHRRDTNERLRSFFEAQGLEFIGLVDISSRTILGGGVRKKLPTDVQKDFKQVSFQNTL